MPVQLRPEDPFYPGDDVASSIQAREACRVGASPTHLTNFIHAHGKVDEPLVCKTDLTRCESGVRVHFHSIQAEIALRSVGNGQKAGASPAGGSALSQRRQVASHLAHNQRKVGSIPAAAIFHAPWSNSQDASLIRRKRWGSTTRSDFHFTGSAYWQTVHPTLNR